MVRSLIFLVSAMLVSACTSGHVQFPVTQESQQKVQEDIEIIRLNKTNAGSFNSGKRGFASSNLPQRNGWEYRVGPGDILTVIVFDHPELTIPTGTGSASANAGFTVQSDGAFFYPFIGSVEARGKTTDVIRADIAKRLAEFLPAPQVEVRVAGFNSQSVVVTGEVESPNRQALTTTPLTLIEAVNAAGGLTDEANGQLVTVQRGGSTYRVDLDGFLNGGLAQNNPILRNGDIVNIARREAEEAYLLGEVRTPQVVNLSRDTVTLTQAVARQGGLSEVRADARGIFVFRNRARGMTVFQLDVTSPSGLVIGTEFELEPDDVIYIVRSPLTRWNDTISRILPSVTAVTTVDGALN